MEATFTAELQIEHITYAISKKEFETRQCDFCLGPLIETWNGRLACANRCHLINDITQGYKVYQIRNVFVPVPKNIVEQFKIKDGDKATFYKAIKEFHRLANRICFKWYEDRDGLSLWKLLPLFKEWKMVNKNTTYNERKYATHWITFVKKQSLDIPTNLLLDQMNMSEIATKEDTP